MSPKVSNAKLVDGDALLYRLFLQLAENDPAGDLVMPLAVLRSMAVWLPRECLVAMPILLPFVVRDPKCRGSRKLGLPDAWSSPNADGYLRDDNSLIKGLAKALTVSAPAEKSLHGARLGNGFVASHVWRETTDGGQLASRRAILNSFVPNIVWLPRQIAKLTDIEGGPYQKALQALSWSIYREVPLSEPREAYVEAAWSLLAQPNVSVESSDDADLNWFSMTEAFLALRRRRVLDVLAALQRLDAGLPLTSKIVTGRYTEGLPTVDQSARRTLAEFLAPLVVDAS